MQKENVNSNSPVQTINEQRRWTSIKFENEQEILKIVTDYIDYNDSTDPMDCIGFLHQAFLENHENIKEYHPEYICTLNYQVKELFLLLSRLQICSAKISNGKRMLNFLNANPA